MPIGEPSGAPVVKRTCPICGYLVPPGLDECASCGASLGEVAQAGIARLGRPALDTFFAVGNVLMAVPFLLVGLFVATRPPHEDTEWLLVFATLFFVIGTFLLVSGIGLWQLRPFGRWIQMAWAALGLLNFPFGTIVSGMLLYYYTRPGIALLYSGRRIEELDAKERWLVQSDAASPLASLLFMLYLLPMLIVFAAMAFFVFVVSTSVPSTP